MPQCFDALTIIMAIMILLLTLYWLLVAAYADSPTANFFSGTMTMVSGDPMGGSQRVPRIENPVVILTLNELTYNTYFSLSMAYNITPFNDYNLFSLNSTVATLNQIALTYKITVQYTVLKDLPFLEVNRVNLTADQTSSVVASSKKIPYDQGVALAAFCMGFSNVNLTTDIFYYTARNSTNYTIYSKSNFQVGDWVLLQLILLNEQADDGLTCQGSYITAISKVNNKSTPFYFERRNNLKYIFGIEAAYLSSGEISYSPTELTVIITGRSLFDFSAVVLNVDCEHKQLTQNTSSGVTYHNGRVFVVLTIVFGSLLGVALLTIGLFFCFVWKRLEWKPLLPTNMETIPSTTDKASDAPPKDIEVGEKAHVDVPA